MWSKFYIVDPLKMDKIGLLSGSVLFNKGICFVGKLPFSLLYGRKEINTCMNQKTKIDEVVLLFLKIMCIFHLLKFVLTKTTL